MSDCIKTGQEIREDIENEHSVVLMHKKMFEQTWVSIPWLKTCSLEDFMKEIFGEKNDSNTKRKL